MTDQSLYGFDDDDVGGPEANHLLIATGHACQLSPGKGGKTCTKLNELHRPNILAVYQKKYNKTHGFVIVSAKCGSRSDAGVVVVVCFVCCCCVMEKSPVLCAGLLAPGI